MVKYHNLVFLLRNPTQWQIYLPVLAPVFFQAVHPPVLALYQQFCIATKPFLSKNQPRFRHQADLFSPSDNKSA
jgi:hypothetical protein